MPGKSRNDDREPITADWLDQWAERQEYCWRIPGSELFVARLDPLKTDLWSICSVDEDGSEPVLANIQDRGELREALGSLGAKADGEELPDFK